MWSGGRFRVLSPRALRRLAILGAVGSIVFFAIIWDGQTERMVNQGFISVRQRRLLLSTLLLPRAFG